jgi:hypothetical protein
MKNTKIMVVTIGTFVATWLLFSFLIWCITPFTFDWIMTNLVTLILMFSIGWIPAVIVGIDYNEYLEKKHEK